MLLVAVAGVIALCGPSAAEVWHEGNIVQTGSWSDDGWAGGAYTMEYSYDGSMVMLVGYGGPDEVRILDRDMEPVGTWEPTGPDLTVEGASWSDASDSVAVWCANTTGGNDTLFILDVPGFEPRVDIDLTNNATLVDITSTRIVAHGAILVVGGRDEHGGSHLQVMETGTSFLLNDIPWKENATVVSIDSDGIELLVIDDEGFLATIDTKEWTMGVRWEGARASPSARSCGMFANDRVAIVGYEDGQVLTWEGMPRDLSGEADAGDGPVLGLASLFQDPRYYAVAVPRGTGGSRIAGWIHNATWGEREWSNAIDVETSVLSMGADPQFAGGFLAAFDDGTIASYSTTIVLNKPPIINITAPERSAKWKGLMTVEGEVTDEVDGVEWVRYCIDGGEWSEVEGTLDFTFQIDMDASSFTPAIHSITVRAFDGTYETDVNYDFKVYKAHDDDGENFWYWFTGCTAIIVVLLAVAYYLRTGRRGAVAASDPKEGGAVGNGDDEGAEP